MSREDAIKLFDEEQKTGHSVIFSAKESDYILPNDDTPKKGK